MSAAKYQQDQRLVAALIAGDANAVAPFLEKAGAAIWPVVADFSGDAAAAKTTYLEVLAALKAQGFARLRAYKGGSSLATFLTLVTRTFLEPQVVQAFALGEDANRTWRQFEKLFANDIHKRISRRFPRARDDWPDFYQEIARELSEQSYRRIKAYKGRGSFRGFILQVVDRLLLDWLRQEVPRRRLPAEVARLPLLDQLVFKAVAWQDIPAEASMVETAIRGKIQPPPTEGDVATALNQMAPAIARAKGGGTKPKDVPLDSPKGGAIGETLPDTGPSPEEDILIKEKEKHVQAVLNAVRENVKELPVTEQLYFHLFFDSDGTLTPREMAPQLGIPVEEVYKLSTRVQNWIKKIRSDFEKTLMRPSAP